MPLDVQKKELVHRMDPHVHDDEKRDIPAHSAVLRQLEALANENSALRSQLSLSCSEKLLKNAFVQEASELLHELATPAPVTTTIQTESECHSLLHALQNQCNMNVELNQKLLQLETEVLLPLRTERERLGQQCEELKRENASLREGESSQTRFLEQQFEQSRRCEASLRRDLDILRNQTKHTSDLVGATLQRLVTSVESSQVNGGESVTVSSLERQLQNSAVAHAAALEAATNDAGVVAQAEMARANLLECTLDEQKTELSSILAWGRSLECQVETLKNRIAEMEAEERSFNMPSYQDLKRRRLEADAVVADFAGRRKELIDFWFDGHEKIEHFENELQSLESLKSNLKALSGELKMLKRDRAVSVESVVALSAEVERLREELVQVRSRGLGLEAENDALVQELARLLAGRMSPEELNSIAHALRIAGEQAAAATTRSVVDPVALQEALQRSQEIRQEIHHLVLRRDELLQCIRLREARISALDGVAATSATDSPVTSGLLFASDHPPMCEELESLRSELRRCLDDKQHLAFEMKMQVGKLHDLLESEKLQNKNLQDQMKAAQLIAHSAVMIASHSSGSIVDQLDVFKSQHAALRAALAKSLEQEDEIRRVRDVSPSSVDLVSLSQKLSDQLTFMRETVESEGRRHAIHETDYILALLGELKNKESSLTDAKRRYEEEIAMAHERLAAKVEAVRKSWNSSLDAAFSDAREGKFKLELRLTSNSAVLPPASISIASEGCPAVSSDEERKWSDRASSFSRYVQDLAA